MLLIKPIGEINIETKHFKGKECIEALEFLEKALGTKVRDIKKSEFYMEQNKNNLEIID